MARPDPIEEIATRLQAVAYGLCDDCEAQCMDVLNLADELRALAADNEEEQPIPTARCLFCGAYFAHETGHTCEQLPRRAGAKEAHHGAA